MANIDPLNISNTNLESKMPPEFRLDFYGFGEQDLDREFVLPTSTYIGGNSPTLKLREIIDRLKVLNFWII